MAQKPSPKDAPANFDDLLASTEDTTSPEAVSENSAPDALDAILDTVEPAKLTPAQERLAAARAQKAELERIAAEDARRADEPDDAEDDEYAGLTEEEIAELKSIEDANAAQATAILDNAPDTFAPAKGKVIIVHVVEDGFTEFGRVWMRGQELHIDQAAYERTKDRNGDTWIDTLLNDPHAQYRKWGRVYVAPGPFQARPGEFFEDSLTKEDARRKGAIPAMTRD